MPFGVIENGDKQEATRLDTGQKEENCHLVNKRSTSRGILKSYEVLLLQLNALTPTLNTIYM